MDPAERITGTRDEHYDLVSVLYHALHGAENCNTYALDAEAAGNQRLAAFFREAGRTQARLSERAKGLLGIEDVASEMDDVLSGTSPGAPIAPPEELVPPDTPSPPGGERSPRTEGVPPSEPPPLV
jgi:hypothetical protein